MHAQRWMGLVLASGLGLAVAFWTLPVRAAGPWYVAPGGADGNNCLSPATACATINAALAKAASGDTINLAVGTYTSSDYAVAIVNRPVVLSGGWNTDFTARTGLSTIDGEDARIGIEFVCSAYTVAEESVVDRIEVTRGRNGINQRCFNAGLRIRDSVVHANQVGQPGESGGLGGAGIAAVGPLTVTRSEISHNVVLGNLPGAGIGALGALVIENSTIDSNSGEGVYVNKVDVTAVIVNSTLTRNKIGLWVYAGAATVRHSILAENVNNECLGAATVSTSLIGSRTNCVTDASDTLIANAASLLDLADNGGLSATRAPAFNSPVWPSATGQCLDGSGAPLTVDQRGAPRLGPCAAGAFAGSFGLEKSAPTYARPGGVATYTVRLTNQVGSDLAGAVVTDTLPVALTAVPGSVSASAGSASFSGNVLSWSGTVPASSSVTITFQAQVDAGAVDQTIANTVQGAWGGFPVASASASLETLARLRLPLLASNDCRPFVDEFDNPNSGWFTGDTATRLVEYLNGTYHVRSKQAGYLFLFEAPTCPGLNYRVETHAYWALDVGSDIGLYFGADAAFDRFYFFDINTKTRQFALYRFNADGTLSVIVAPTASTAIAPGDTLPNTLAVIARGSTGQITLEINGTTLGTWTDPTLSGLTWSGLGMAPYDNQPVADARFNRFSLSPATASAGATTANAPASIDSGSAVSAGWPGHRPLRAPGR